MTTNKTPIQELIEDYSRKYKNILILLEDAKQESNQIRLRAKSSCYREAINDLGDVLEKEKAFAFDCYTSGLESWTWNYTDGTSDVGSPTFDEFYLKYAKQHNK